MLKFWPTKRWKKIVLTTLLILLAALLSVGGYLEYSVYREVPSDTQVLNNDGAKTALVIYHPGLTDYAKNVTFTYAEALAASGWRVEVATANQKAPTNINHYQLLTLVWALYDFNPAPTVTNQLHRFGNLNGIQTVIIAIGGGLDPFKAASNMNNIVLDANGTIVQSFTAYRGHSNTDLLTQKATELTL